MLEFDGAGIAAGEFIVNRRYKKPKVISLVNSMKKIFPQQRFWDKVLSGERYTNYLHEAAAGQWGPNPPGITKQSIP